MKQWIPTDKFVFLGASEHCHKANEIVGAGIRGGAFTFSLLEALATLQQNGVGHVTSYLFAID